MKNQQTQDDIRNAVRQRYGDIAESNQQSSNTPCCAGPDPRKASMELGYTDSDLNQVPEGANMGLGCGNPRAIASLKEGETVLDLGSGGGFDCFLAAKEIGETGKVIGVDMTPKMISKARANAEKSGYRNVEFRLGEIEHLPVADAVVDVIISNCVINLSPDKARVIQESYRVLKPGGRFVISDIVASADLPEELKNDMDLFTGCMGGASLLTELESMLQEAGFQSIEIKPKDNSKEFIRKWAPGTGLEEYILSAYIEATKPVSQLPQ